MVIFIKEMQSVYAIWPFGHAKRGIKKVNIEICKSCYINRKGNKSLCEMKTFLELQGIEVKVQTN